MLLLMFSCSEALRRGPNPDTIKMEEYMDKTIKVTPKIRALAEYIHDIIQESLKELDNTGWMEVDDQVYGLVLGLKQKLKVADARCGHLLEHIETPLYVRDCVPTLKSVFESDDQLDTLTAFLNDIVDELPAVEDRSKVKQVIDHIDKVKDRWTDSTQEIREASWVNQISEINIPA